MAQANLGGPHGGGASGLGGEGEVEGDAEQDQEQSGKCGDMGLLAADAEAEAGWLPWRGKSHAHIMAAATGPAMWLPVRVKSNASRC